MTGAFPPTDDGLFPAVEAPAPPAPPAPPDARARELIGEYLDGQVAAARTKAMLAAAELADRERDRQTWRDRDDIPGQIIGTDDQIHMGALAVLNAAQSRQMAATTTAIDRRTEANMAAVHAARQDVEVLRTWLLEHGYAIGAENTPQPARKGRKR